MKHLVTQYVEGIRNGNRRFMGKAITLIESTAPEKFEMGQAILEQLLPDTGNALRLGITGVPGVGKSTMIEAFGLHLIGQGHKVAVFSIDPSSPITGGSIMGDKTRMVELSAHKNAFIRPSPSGGLLGGVARKTREIMMVCEAAGYDTIIVETVGVGQSETMVSTMVDCFLALMLPNAGDELQGIKKGIMELADLIVINKADGSNLLQAESAKADYARALKFLRSSHTQWTPQVLTCSAIEKRGLGTLWEKVETFRSALQESGEWQKQREKQALQWMWNLIDSELHGRFRNDPQVSQKIENMEHRIQQGHVHPTSAAYQLLSLWDRSHSG